jgi:ankyrin repeat protein
MEFLIFSKMSALNPASLESLPPEVLLSTLANQPYADILRLCQVSRQFAFICSYWQFWSQKAHRDFEFPQTLFQQTSLSPTQRYLQIRQYYLQPEQAFEEAAATGQVNLLDYLFSQLELPPEPEVLNHLLELAARNGHLEVVQFLVKEGATDFRPAMELAETAGQWPVYQYLEDALASQLNFGLLSAASEGDLDFVTYYVAEGATDINGALVEAAKFCQPNVVPFLLHQGATDIDTPRQIAQRQNCQAIVDILDEWNG